MEDRTSGVDMIYRFGNKKPSISKSAFIAETACIIGDGVIIGHGCIVHGKNIKDYALIGMNATILHGAEIGKYAIVGAGALVPPNYKVPANTVVMGVPCKEIRKTNEEDIEIIRNTIENYGKLTEEYLKMKG